MQRGRLNTGSQTQRIASIDLLRGVVMIIMFIRNIEQLRASN